MSTRDEWNHNFSAGPAAVGAALKRGLPDRPAQRIVAVVVCVRVEILFSSFSDQISICWDERQARRTTTNVPATIYPDRRSVPRVSLFSVFCPFSLFTAFHSSNKNASLFWLILSVRFQIFWVMNQRWPQSQVIIVLFTSIGTSLMWTKWKYWKNVECLK